LSRPGEPALLSNWERSLFIHFEVDPDWLQAETPFRLDLREGKAYVSLVAFTMSRMRPRLGGRLAEWCFKPVATHPLLNVRTYVRHRGEAGIYFLTEWVPNRISAFWGPRTFGLPYRLGNLTYHHDHENGVLQGCVQSAAHGGRLEYRAELPAAAFHPCTGHSVDDFLLERYTAFTEQHRSARFFRVWHAPWQQQKVEVRLLDDSLLRETASWFEGAKLAGANYSPGVEDVWMGWPHKLEKQGMIQHSVASSFYEMP
jgi:hypothetical protein